MNTVYLLLGSNEGDRSNHIEKSIGELSERVGTIILESSVYETAAWGMEDQPGFLNRVVMLHTLLDPMAVLSEIQSIEYTFKRQRTVKWGQRTLDIDILFYDDDILNTPDLVIPHQYIQDRRFTLVPLSEIAPLLIHPISKKTITQLLLECTDILDVIKYNK